jgi:hypothetical protein
VLHKANGTSAPSRSGHGKTIKTRASVPHPSFLTKGGAPMPYGKWKPPDEFRDQIITLTRPLSGRERGFK